MSDDWVREEPERAASEEIGDRLVRVATRWVFGEGISSGEFAFDLEHLEWIGRIAQAIGEERAKAIWAEVDEDIRTGLAERARLVVPGHVVDAWLASENPYDYGFPDWFERAARGEEVTPDLSPEDELPNPAHLVQEGLRLIDKAQRDRDLFDQLGLPESEWCEQH
jgi:hypothetical protein